MITAERKSSVEKFDHIKNERRLNLRKDRWIERQDCERLKDEK